MIDPNNIKIEEYPPRPAGMYHNGSRSGIIVHHASGISVAFQSERSQHKNKEACMQVLEDYFCLRGETG